MHIRSNWGERVAKIVRGCTDGVADVTGQKPDWYQRKRTYLEHLRSVDTDILLVSACDKLHNARTIDADLRAGHDVFARFKAGRDGTLWYYQSLVETFASRLVSTAQILSELTLTVTEMVELAGQRWRSNFCTP